MAKLKTEIKIVNFRNIQEADINPQQMKEAEFKRLVNSVKKDGILTSTILLQDLGGVNISVFQAITGLRLQ